MKHKKPAPTLAEKLVGFLMKEAGATDSEEVLNALGSVLVAIILCDDEPLAFVQEVTGNIVRGVSESLVEEINSGSRK